MLPLYPYSSCLHVLCVAREFYNLIWFVPNCVQEPSELTILALFPPENTTCLVFPPNVHNKSFQITLTVHGTRLECLQRTNSDVWVHHLACKFPGFYNKPPTLYRYWGPIIYFKWQEQGSQSSFRPLTGWGLHRFLWKSQWEYLKGRPIECYHFQPTFFSHWSIPLNLKWQYYPFSLPSPSLTFLPHVNELLVVIFYSGVYMLQHGLNISNMLRYLHKNRHFFKQ
jgi:hypothetical protein